MKLRNTALPTIALSLAMPALAQQPANAGDNQIVLEEIIVTARKRSETVMEIPMTVSAFSAKDIENAGFTNVADLIEAVPGVTFGGYQAEGQGDSPSFRGVATNTGDPTLQNSSKFVDGVYVSGSLATILLTDIERVEVIKGPQSALFGRATFSGAINYITKKPTDELSGSVNATFAEYGEQRLNGTVSGPIIAGKLAGRISAGIQKDGSPYNNITNGAEMGDNDVKTGSVSLSFTPTEALSANLYLSYTDAQLGEAIRATTGLNEGELDFPDVSVIGGNVDQLDNPGIDSEAMRINLTVDYDLNGYTLTSITGHGYEDTLNQADGNYDPSKVSFLSFLCNEGPFVGPDCSIFQTVTLRELETNFQEFRITSPDGEPLRWLAGVSYFDEEFLTDRQRNFSQSPVNKTTDNISIYGSVSYDFTEMVTVTADARYQQEEVEVETLDTGALQQGDFNSFLPRVIVEYSPSDSALVYASVSKGNKPGTFNAVGPPEFAVVDEEQLWSYEIGTKFSTADNRFSVEASLYYMDWTDQVFRFNDPRPTVGSYFINAGETDIYGIDLSAVARLTTNLRATFAYSHVAAEFNVFESTLAETVTGNSDVSGNATPRAPENSLFASLQYNAPLALWGGGNDWFARADVSYRDEQYIDEINLEYLAPQTLVNLRTGIDTGAVRLTLFVDNAFDNDAQTTGFRFGAVALVGLPVGRQFGVTANYDF
ncbi:MAG: iron complex outermembrane receptor protein [Halieaceae bacterium]|jgi:iron complex outermembrane receptor protein